MNMNIMNIMIIVVLFILLILVVIAHQNLNNYVKKVNNEQFLVRFNVNGTPAMNVNNQNFTEGDQMDKLKLLDEQIKTANKNLKDMKKKKNNLSKALGVLNKGIDDLIAKKDEFLKAQMELKQSIYT